jgi:biopolymer transport protein ExbB
MFDVVRQTAGDTSKHLESSLISGQFPGRTRKLQQLSVAKELPDFKKVSDLWITMLQEMTEQAKIARFKAPLIGTDGNEKTADIIRIGPFSAIKDGAFVTYEPGLARLKELSRQPGGKYLQAARAVEKAGSGEMVGVPIDPSRGSILGLLVQTPSLEERVQQGGFVGYVILGVGAFGILLALFKIITLKFTSLRVSRQKRRLDEPRSGNPLGRVLVAIQQFNLSDTDAIDRKLDELVMKEVPKLETGIPLVKLLAAIAPLLGLLGTVVGMILTFQSITLFGTGDPKLMAGGISQALVTTVLGLVTAIPLLLLHSVASGTAGRIGQVLEEQAAGLIARRLEAESDATVAINNNQIEQTATSTS